VTVTENFLQVTFCSYFKAPKDFEDGSWQHLSVEFQDTAIYVKLFLPLLSFHSPLPTLSITGIWTPETTARTVITDKNNQEFLRLISVGSSFSFSIQSFSKIRMKLSTTSDTLLRISEFLDISYYPLFHNARKRKVPQTGSLSIHTGKKELTPVSGNPCKVNVILRPTVCRPVCTCIRPPSGTRDQLFFPFHINYLPTFAVFPIMAPPHPSDERTGL
jgi:hypothetical protein